MAKALWWRRTDRLFHTHAVAGGGEDRELREIDGVERGHYQCTAMTHSVDNAASSRVIARRPLVHAQQLAAFGMANSVALAAPT